MYKQQIIDAKNNIWVVCEEGKDYTKPADAVTFAFDTETITYIDDTCITKPFNAAAVISKACTVSNLGDLKFLVFFRKLNWNVPENI